MRLPVGGLYLQFEKRFVQLQLGLYLADLCLFLRVRLFVSMVELLV